MVTSHSLGDTKNAGRSTSMQAKTKQDLRSRLLLLVYINCTCVLTRQVVGLLLCLPCVTPTSTSLPRFNSDECLTSEQVQDNSHIVRRLCSCSMSAVYNARLDMRQPFLDGYVVLTAKEESLFAVGCACQLRALCLRRFARDQIAPLTVCGKKEAVRSPASLLVCLP